MRCWCYYVTTMVGKMPLQVLAEVYISSRGGLGSKTTQEGVHSSPKHPPLCPPPIYKLSRFNLEKILPKISSLSIVKSFNFCLFFTYIFVFFWGGGLNPQIPLNLCCWVQVTTPSCILLHWWLRHPSGNPVSVEIHWFKSHQMHDSKKKITIWPHSLVPLK